MRPDCSWSKQNLLIPKSHTNRSKCKSVERKKMRQHVVRLTQLKYEHREWNNFTLCNSDWILTKMTMTSKRNVLLVIRNNNKYCQLLKTKIRVTPSLEWYFPSLLVYKACHDWSVEHDVQYYVHQSKSWYINQSIKSEKEEERLKQNKSIPCSTEEGEKNIKRS